MSALAYAPDVPVPQDAPRMLPYLARAARQFREERGVEIYEVAYHAGFPDPQRVRRFESAKAWSTQIDRLIAGYAAALSISVVEIWARAVELMIQDADGAAA